MLVNRLAGLVLPGTSKYLIDDVIGKHQGDLLVWLAAGGGRSHGRAGGDLLRAVAGAGRGGPARHHRHAAQCRRRTSCACRSRYFDSTKTGVLISRIMTDAEGIRNLVGTGLVQLVGSLVTAAWRSASCST